MPEANCTKCGQSKRIVSKGLCSTCYSEETEVKTSCSKCGKYRKVISSKVLCKSCYETERLSKNEEAKEQKRLYQKEYHSRPENKEKERARNKRRRENPDYVKKQARNSFLRNIARYGVTEEQYNTMVSRGCAVCGSTERPHLDHDHETGKFRDLLCGKCNQALGLLQDSSEIVGNLLKYINKHK